VVADTSALVAILFAEPDAARFADAIAAAPTRVISAFTRVELSCVIEGRKGEEGRRDLENLLRDGAFEIAPVTLEHAELAIGAYRRFGKGRHPAALNIGDCFSYALARSTSYRLLYKGNDFALTDIRAAI